MILQTRRAIAYGRKINNEVNVIMEGKETKQKKKEKKKGRGKAWRASEQKGVGPVLCFRTVTLVMVQELKTRKWNIL